MVKTLRIMLVSVIALICGNVMAQKVTIDFNNDYKTLFPTITGTSSGDFNDGDFNETTTSTPVESVTVIANPNKVELTLGEDTDEPDIPNYEGTGEGTQESPYNVARALSIIAAGDYTNDEVYVSGIISEITEISLQYGNAIYFISDDGTTAKQLEIYRGYSLEGNKFTSKDEIKIGDKVIVCGKLTNYNGTYEFTTGSKIVSLTTGISDIKADMKNAPIYNLNGQRVDNPKKGLYIIGGKKYVVK